MKWIGRVCGGEVRLRCVWKEGRQGRILMMGNACHEQVLRGYD